MLISLILTVWIVSAALFCLGLCSAAARPMPLPDMAGGSDDQPLRMPRVAKLQPVLWLAVVLAVITSSCATIPPGSHPVNLRGSEPVKGATQLMQH